MCLDKLVSLVLRLAGAGLGLAGPSLGRALVTVEQVFEMLESAMRSEEEFVEEFVDRRELLRAAEAQARLRALEAFRHLVLANLALEKGKTER